MQYDYSRHRSHYRPYEVRNMASRISYLNKELRDVEACIWSITRDLQCVERDVEYVLLSLLAST